MTAPKKSSIVLSFTLERETKNTVRYQETNDPQTIGTLYVQKMALKALAPGDGYPEALTVTLEA